MLPVPFTNENAERESESLKAEESDMKNPTPSSSSESMASFPRYPTLSPTTVCLPSNQPNEKPTVKLLHHFPEKSCDSYIKNSPSISNFLEEPASYWLCLVNCHRISRGAFTIWKIFTFYLLIILMFGFVYIYTVPSDVEEEFNLTLSDSFAEYLLSVSYHRLNQIVLLCSIQPEDYTETLFDLKHELVAHRDLINEKCYIRSALTPQFLQEYEKLQEMLETHETFWWRPLNAVPMLILGRKVHDEVINNIAKNPIASFCKNYSTYWLVNESHDYHYQIENRHPSNKRKAKYKSVLIGSSFYPVILYQKIL